MVFFGGGVMIMGFRRRLAVVLLLILMVMSVTAIPSSRSLKDAAKVGNFQHQVVKELMGYDGEASLVEIRLGERRMDVELADYPGTGANNNHDPRTPGRF